MLSFNENYLQISVEIATNFNLNVPKFLIYRSPQPPKTSHTVKLLLLCVPSKQNSYTFPLTYMILFYFEAYKFSSIMFKCASMHSVSTSTMKPIQLPRSRIHGSLVISIVTAAYNFRLRHCTYGDILG